MNSFTIFLHPHQLITEARFWLWLSLSMESKRQEMSTQTILITGANRGIGLSLAKLYAQRANTTVIGACRNPKKDGEELQKNKCKVVELDVSSDESCATLPTRLKELGVTELNLLINNAGIGIFDKLYQCLTQLI